ncbi:phosphoribosylglycinamide formyltransferase [Candidatus Pantoea edessiphila]|uniref:Phosphoribosylglycinamide formyltransferase n=1 Tax=Candidatus Pantoea edessiphila TaxID=2044610 RepID=A0A2P5T2W1_9GAMM|nr:phosphoribosylglycinamide formyltransferase [Candidatus Pantoea edessiphila]PPI88918.1 phosphoribosylglycinamide formyltransferase [Candidatus Pantoea edessiphila]
MKKIIVLISGKGSNLKFILHACKNKIKTGKVVAVLSNNPLAYGLIYAKKAYIPNKIISESKIIDRIAYDIKLIKEIDIYNPDLIVLAGYMRILSDVFIQHYKGIILNIHPSLLPKYPGLHTHRLVLENHDLEHGSSVHFVTNKLDGGPIILQSRIPILPEDTENSIIKRIKQQEHIIYPIVIKWFIEKRLKMEGGKAWLNGEKLPLNGYEKYLNKL